MIKQSDVKYLVDEVKENYKYLHQHPELGFEEFNTSKFVVQKLKEYGVSVENGIALTGVIGTIKGTFKGKTVAIRADMDALPITEQADVCYASKNLGVMHACGHDAHTAMLLGTAKYLSEHRDMIKGTVKLLFQPAEEGASEESTKKSIAAGCSEDGGAASMIKDGALSGVDACFALHVFPNLKAGEFLICKDRAMASSDMFTVIICGKGGHGASPESAIDPVQALASILSAYNQLPSREFSALESCVVTVGTINTDSSWNIIPDKIVVTGNIRTFDNGVREQIIKRLEEMADNIAKAHRCTAEFIRSKGYDTTTNSVEISAFMRDVAVNVLGKEKVIYQDKPFTGSEDVGNYFEIVPGALGWLGAMPEDPSATVAAHSPKFTINLDALEFGVLINVNNTIEYLNSSSVR